MSGRLFVFSAPSGTGKTTIINALKKNISDLFFSVSYTSREPRENEIHGVDYFFVNRSTFKKMIRDEDFVEWAEVYGNYYGTSLSAIKDHLSNNIDVLLDIDPQGARNIKMHFEDSILIFIVPPSYEVLEQRLVNRGTDHASTVENRMKEASSYIRNCVWYDYLLINDDFDTVVTKARSIISAERCRTVRLLPEIKKIFKESFF